MENEDSFFEPFLVDVSPGSQITALDPPWPRNESSLSGVSGDQIRTSVQVLPRATHTTRCSPFFIERKLLCRAKRKLKGKEACFDKVFSFFIPVFEIV